MIGFIAVNLTFAIFGILVQYTTFGNMTELKKMEKINIAEKEGRQEQYQELLIQNDRLLLNRKKIWAVFFLCFSIPRNLCILFYDFEKRRKVSFMRFLRVLGFLWILFPQAYYWGFLSYPTNI